MKKIILIFLFMGTFLPHNAYSLSCVGDLPKVSLYEFASKNDVIFIGKRMENTVPNTPTEYEVVEPLKGIDNTTAKIFIYETGRGIAGEPSIWYLHKDNLYLAYASYQDGKLTETIYPLCVKRPYPQEIVDYLKTHQFEKESSERQTQKNLIIAVSIIFLITAAFAAIMFIRKRVKT